ncbi:hypothetical protein LEN26_001230 [Aphanomyces euteiches]|nr:hypothetical protein LEN26_001230 [Aphanomyces euteiches]
MSAVISADDFLANGSDKLHDMLATHLEAAMGKAMPQVEIRFKDLSIAADVVVATKDGANELPTLANEAKKFCMSLAQSKNAFHKDILYPVSGVFKPATMTLLLGQPGSGKSSLMKMLAGRFPADRNVTINGSVTYNGVKSSEVKKKIPQLVSYISQRDYHFPQLTVHETMEFAHECCGGVVPQRVLDSLASGTPEESARAKEIIEALYQVYPDIIVRQMGLTNCKDTIVGDAMLRGVSGGERKRVTIGEMEFGMKQVSLMDEISTGLDLLPLLTSSSRSKAWPMFELFNNVMVMNEGYVMYHGPRAEVLEYFESFGFNCPPNRDVADFLLDLCTPQQHQYVATGNSSVPRYPSDFAALFEESSIYRNMVDHVDGPVHPLLLQDANKHMKETPQFQNDFKTSTMQLVRRQTKLLLRNTALVKTRAIMVVYGPAVLHNSILFLALGQVALLPSYFDAREIFYKQRSANFYRTLSFVLAQTISQIPFSAAEAVVFGSIIYWISGFVANAGAFFIYELILLMTNILFATWFFFIAVISPNLHVAKPLCLLSDFMFVLFAGFIIQINDIPDYLVWIHWINPFSWALKALAVNQYLRPEFNVCSYDGVEYCATNGGKTMDIVQLELFRMPTSKAWIWYCVLYLIFLYFVIVAMALGTLEYIRYDNNHGNALSDEQRKDTEENDGVYVKMPPTPVASQGSDSVIVPVESFIPVTLAFKDCITLCPTRSRVNLT